MTVIATIDDTNNSSATTSGKVPEHLFIVVFVEGKGQPDLTVTSPGPESLSDIEGRDSNGTRLLSESRNVDIDIDIDDAIDVFGVTNSPSLSPSPSPRVLSKSCWSPSCFRL